MVKFDRIKAVSPRSFSFLVPVVSSMRSLIHSNKQLIEAANLDYEMIIVSDGPYNNRLPEGPTVRFIEGPQSRMAGNRQRQIAMDLAEKEFCVFLDQDCRLNFDGLVALKDVTPNRLNVFHIAMHFDDLTVIKKGPRGLDSTHCGARLVPPTTLARQSWWWRPGWPDHHHRDEGFSTDMLSKDPKAIVHNEILMHWYKRAEDVPEDTHNG